MTIMTVNEIVDQWEVDAKINPAGDLGIEIANVYKLHAKYLRYYALFKVYLGKQRKELKILKKNKVEFYGQGPATMNEHRKMPDQGKVLKSQIPYYVDSDEEVSAATSEIVLTEEKIEALSHILTMVQYRSNSIKTILDYKNLMKGNG